MRLVLTDLNQALMKPNEQLRPHLPYDLYVCTDLVLHEA